MASAAAPQWTQKDLPLYQFRSKPVSLAYDSASKLLAVGCENGKIVILGGGEQKYCELEHSAGKAVHLMSFMTNKNLLLTSDKKTKDIFLWSPPKVGHVDYCTLNNIPTVLTWSSARSAYIVGTKNGTVQTIAVNESRIQASNAVHISSEHGAHGEVVAIVEQPCRAREGAVSHNILVVFSRGLCVIWNWKAEETQVINTKVAANPLYAWWRNADIFLVAYDNGSLWSYDVTRQVRVTVKGKDHYSIAGVTKDDPPVTPIRKYQYISSTRPWLVYTGGCSSVHDGSKDSHIVSSFTHPNTDLPIVPFNDEVVDILCLPLMDQESPVLAVLTASELVMLNLSEKAKEIDCGSVKMIRYPRFMNSNDHPHITAQVTSLQHCGDCSKELLKAFNVCQGPSTLELIITGHKNGSVYLWLCYYDEAKNVILFKCPLVIYTAEHYNTKTQAIKAGDQKQLDITFTKVTASQQCLLVVNSSCHMLLYQLYPCPTSSSIANPQSQEIILKDYQDDTQPAKSIQTPPPHFRPCQWQTRVELLQHFSCHYQSGRGKQPVPVTVNCADYNEQMGMLAVGTSKGLIVLDTLTNQLIQVIGSEKKLLRLSECNPSQSDTRSTPSKSECKVTELQIVAANVPQKKPMLTLWAGTARGSLGVFHVTRKNTKDINVLKLLKTGKGKQMATSVVGIHFLDQKADPSKATPDSTIVVLTTQKEIQIFPFHDSDHVTMTKCAEQPVLRSGLICAGSGSQCVITLTGKKEIVAYSIADLSPINKLKMNDAALISGGGGSHAVVYSDKKLQLTSIL